MMISTMKIIPLSTSVYKADLPPFFDGQALLAFEKTMLSLSEQSPVYVIVDFVDVNFIDSAAFRSLLKMTKMIREKDGEIYIVNLHDPVRIIFELTKTESSFGIFPTAADALAEIQSKY